MNGTTSAGGFWIRVVATFIDGLIFLPTFVLLILDLLWWKSFLVVVIVSIPSLLYKPFMESFKGATLGKMACGLRVIDEHGENLTLGRAYLRYLPNLAVLFVGLLNYALLFANPDFLAATTLMDYIKIPQSNELGAASFAIQFFTLIDCLTVAFNEQKRAIHDYLANSYCVRGTMPYSRHTQETENAFFCSNCNYEIPRDAKFCPNCGTRFEEQQG